MRELKRVGTISSSGHICITYIYMKYIIRNLIKSLTHDVSMIRKYQISNYPSPKSLVNNLFNMKEIERSREEN
jgi:hypothetical protein